MIAIVLALVLGGGLGILGPGSLASLHRVRVRWWPLAVGAALSQCLLGLLPGGLRLPLLLVSCGAVMAWCALNLRQRSTLPGMALLSAGIVLNTAVIAANGGMPVSVSALARAGFSARLDLRTTFPYKHLALTHATVMSHLGDVIPLRALHTVLSVGDVLMLAGAFGFALGATLIPTSASPLRQEAETRVRFQPDPRSAQPRRPRAAG